MKIKATKILSLGVQNFTAHVCNQIMVQTEMKANIK